MTPEEEAHWRYQLEILTSWGYHAKHITGTFDNVPEQIVWLREEARYNVCLANVHRQRLAMMAQTIEVRTQDPL